MSLPALPWTARMAARSVVIRSDLHRLWRLEGPLGRTTTRAAVAMGVGNAGRELVSRPGEDDEDGENKVSPHERDGRNAGVGKRYRMSLVPKRNLFYCTWIGSWNALQAMALAARGLFAMVGAEVHARGLATGIPIGLFRGASVAIQYVFLGFVINPLLMLVCGARNHIRGARNIVAGDQFFDSELGRYAYADTVAIRQRYGLMIDQQLGIAMEPFLADFRHSRREANAFKSTPAGKALGFLKSLFRSQVRDRTREKLDKSAAGTMGMDEVLRSDGDDLYDVLQVPSTASHDEIKKAYKRLVTVFHPDKNKSPDARRTFDEITAAYKVLGDPKAREAYDMAGTRGSSAAAQMAEMTKAKGSGRRRVVGGISNIKDGKIMGAPNEVYQAMFGGLPFCDLLIGPALRSPMHMMTQNSVLITIQDFESLQVHRMKRQAAVLTALLDAYALEDLPLTALKVAKERRIVMKDKVDDLLADVAAEHQTQETKSAATAARAKQTSQVRAKSANSASNKDSASPAAMTSAATGGKKTTAGAAKNKVADPDQARPPTDFVSKEYANRLDRFAARMARCCFGPELQYEYGAALVASAKRYRKESAFYKPKKLAWSKTAQGFTRFFAALRLDLKEKGAAGIAAMNLFGIEFENMVADIHQVVRFMCITIHGDSAVPKIVADDLRRQLGLDYQGLAMSASPAGGVVASEDEPRSSWSSASSSSSVPGYKRGAAASAAGPVAEISEGFFVSLPTRLTQGTQSQQKAVVRECRELYETLSEKQRAAWIEATAKVVKQRRLDAMMAMGVAFKNKGRDFNFRDMDAATNHFRANVNSHENTTLPPVF